MLGCVCEHSTKRSNLPRSGMGMGDVTESPYPVLGGFDVTGFDPSVAISEPQTVTSSLPNVSGGGGSSMPSFWDQIIGQGFQTGYALTKDVLGTHPTLQTSGPQGTSTYYAPAGSPASAINIPGFATGTLSTSTIVIAAIVALGIAYAMSSGRH